MRTPIKRKKIPIRQKVGDHPIFRQLDRTLTAFRTSENRLIVLERRVRQGHDVDPQHLQEIREAFHNAWHEFRLASMAANGWLADSPTVPSITAEPYANHPNRGGVGSKRVKNAPYPSRSGSIGK